jgi:hypothetical protein
MRFPRTLLGLASCAILIAVMAACGSSGAPQTSQHLPPPTATNYTTCDSQQVPNWQSNLFIENYQPAIAAVITHYASNSSVGYMRIGLGRGGEIDLPQGWNNSSSGSCYSAYSTSWGYTAGAPGDTWNTYLQTMVQYEATQSSPFPLLVSITPINGVGTEPDDFIAQVANQNGVSFGNQGLEASDITNYPSCAGDWCNLFAQYPNTTVRELQTLGQSCPASISSSCPNNLSSETGPLPPLLELATGLGGSGIPVPSVPANDLELYYQDWLVAYDPDYANSLGVSSSDQSAYQAAIQAAFGTGATMQVIFPPESTDTTMCGSLTCYQAIQQYLVTGPGSAYISGFVLDIDWSDFDPGNGNATGNYTFAIPDATVSSWTVAGKKVNLVLQNTTYGGSGCPSAGSGSLGNVGSNCAMPAWMWTVLQ